MTSADKPGLISIKVLVQLLDRGEGDWSKKGEIDKTIWYVVTSQILRRARFVFILCFCRAVTSSYIGMSEDYFSLSLSPSIDVQHLARTCHTNNFILCFVHRNNH